MLENQEEISKLLQSSKFSTKLLSLYRADPAIMFEDVVSELYLYCHDNNIIDINEDIVFQFLKDIHSKNRKHSHGEYIDTIDNHIEYTGGETFNMDNMLNSSILDKCKNLNFTDEEIRCLLYLQDNKNVKKYDYRFIKKNNEKSIDKNKLRVYYENIIKKLLKML